MRFRTVAFVVFVLASPSGAKERHWAYVPPVAPSLPANVHPVDHLLAAAWEKAGIEPAGEATPRQRVERAAYTLTGLPPSDGLLRRFEASPDGETWKAVVNELLEDPAYGERWARHWMDVARYADTRGYHFDQDNRYPFAYTYRDWLIRAFNEDMPYDRFVKLQIAADLLTDRPDDPDLAALGFLTVGLRAGGVETIDDRVDVVTRGFLSSTVSCARCHDHKTDPTTMRDYYSLYSILENTDEPEDKPVIGKPADEAAYQGYLAEVAKLEEEDLVVRRELVGHIRSPEILPAYLELAWVAGKEDWNLGKATSEGFKRGKLRPNAILRWRDFLKEHKESGRLNRWFEAMEGAGEGGRKSLCIEFAKEWLAAEGELAALASNTGCPLSYDVDRINGFMDVEDDGKRRARSSAMSRLLAEHAGSPPRAMVLKDRANWSQAVVFLRGNPATRGETFEREWLSFLGGGKFEEGKSPRLSLAEKIVSPDNPLTDRVIVNRVWAWHFGAPLVDPGDFGPQTPKPELLELLDDLAIRFRESGRSLKELHRLLLDSRAFRLASTGPAKNDAIDQDNGLFWKWNRRRLDFESMRDRVLVTGGALDTGAVGGRSVRLEDPTSDSRRSVYAFVDRYALPGLFVSFDLPHPDHHSPKRVETTVPQQALYFLNSPLVVRQAERIVGEPAFRSLPDDRAKVHFLYQRVFGRAPSSDEIVAALDWLAGADPADYTPRLGGHWLVRHGPDPGHPSNDIEPFPLFADDVWKTGPDPAMAPIRWLSVGRGAGHASAGRALVLRWTATGAGQARMAGHLKRTQQGGATLAWRIDGKGEILEEAKLAPDTELDIGSRWIDVSPGDTLDFVLRAPDGDSCGGVAWTLRIEGRDGEGSPVFEAGDFTREFPTKAEAPPAKGPVDPWADLVQMLWASNEFHFID